MEWAVRCLGLFKAIPTWESTLITCWSGIPQAARAPLSACRRTTRFDPVLHPSRPETWIADEEEMTARPSFEQGHPGGDGRQDPEPSEGCGRHKQQGKQSYNPRSENGKKDDRDEPPIGRLLPIESSGDALRPDASCCEEPQQNSDRKREADDRRKEDQLRSLQGPRNRQENEQANQERNTHGQTDRKSGDQPHPSRL